MNVDIHIRSMLNVFIPAAQRLVGRRKTGWSIIC